MNTPAGNTPSAMAPANVSVIVVPVTLNSNVVAAAVAVVVVANAPSSAITSASAPVIFPEPAAKLLSVLPGIKAELIEPADSASL